MFIRYRERRFFGYDRHVKHWKMFNAFRSAKDIERELFYQNDTRFFVAIGTQQTYALCVGEHNKSCRY